MWRFTGNVTHEKLLRPALELHAEWALECFDADGDGLYHAYINTWPTDAVQFNGAGAPEESGYMYRTALALRDMARRANDTAAMRAHAATAAKIKDAFFAQLWLSDRGHPGAFKEEIGHQRVRPDAWLYSIFVPIEAGLLDQEQAAQALFYTEWALQRDPLPCPDGEGECGVRVWTSNWVPSIWSVREFWPGDNYALALAYFKAGLPEGGYAVLRGNLLHDMYDFVSPGGLGASIGGMDFNDIVHPFARAIVEGLFGFEPDFPNGRVTVSPQFPPTWTNASIRTRHLALAYRDDTANKVLTLTLQLLQTQAGARLVVKVPVRSQSLSKVTLDGVPVDGNALVTNISPGFGCAVVTITTPTPVTSATIMLYYNSADPETMSSSVFVDAAAGSEVTLAPPAGWQYYNMSDPQGVFEVGSVSVTPTRVTGTVAATGHSEATHHMLFGYIKPVSVATPHATTLPRALMYKVNVTDRDAEAWLSNRTDVHMPAKSSWEYIDLSARLNANISLIYHPAAPGYVSPRPPTCSARIGTDGYSAWTFTYGQGNHPPFPDLSGVKSLLNSEGKLQTPGGALFDATHMMGAGHNIAFTSQWDNFPTSVTVPVSAQHGDVVWLLVAGSTNPMQTLLPNARIVFNFTDGSSEALELTPPKNFWCLSNYGGDGARNYYDYEHDGHCLPSVPPRQVRLGSNANAMVYSWNIVGAQRELESITLETLSLEVVIGLCAVSVMKTNF